MTCHRPDPEREAVRDALRTARALMGAADQLAADLAEPLLSAERDALRQAFAALDKFNPTVR